ncbi:MAG TPA: UTP--glucose-1-phosphate uridylyltransferase [Verrucomicrobiales bacterium]|nr:UTP--glucose-1-phosphate uridylyltransferase [Verrucomicrobiales bacterium]HIL69020.1 UTP--glucose-1-phosphate uridylyltransferase [Verrucomicrobiota bacterium]
MKITKAVITAAGLSQRTLPLQGLVDVDGVGKSALQVLIEEVLDAGIQELCLVVHPGDQRAYSEAAGDYASLIHWVEQTEPLGYAHALGLSRNFVDGEPFLHLLGDHLYLSRIPTRCARQLVQLAESESCSVSSVQATPESQLSYFGTVGGHRIPGRNRVYEINCILEKPSPTEAEQKIIVPGLRSGHYLCFFGMHVFTSTFLDILVDECTHLPLEDQRCHSLADALNILVGRERYLAAELEGRRFNVGARYGLMFAQFACALAGSERDEIMRQLIELLALNSPHRVRSSEEKSPPMQAS